MPDFTFHHGGVSVPDLDAAIAWYGNVLGFELERRFDKDRWCGRWESNPHSLRNRILSPSVFFVTS
jgi:catechol 2,3-dioxygenase-like lactoylglutathione lyase family enzyme